MQLTFIIVTRNRAHRVLTALDSVLRAAHALNYDAGPIEAWIVDDSTIDRDREDNRRLARKATRDAIRVRYIGRAQDATLRAGLRKVSRDFVPLERELCRPLGAPGWNLGSARNVAFLFATSQLGYHAPVCLMDDDILIQGDRYRGVDVQASGLSMIREGIALSVAHMSYVIGPVFLGREDMSITRHLAKCALHPDAASPSSDRYFPVYIAQSLRNLDAQPGVPSSGCLLTTPSTMSQAPQFPCYNEDWVWARLIQSHSMTDVRRIDAAVIHAADPEPWPSTLKVAHQECGEVLYETLSGWLASIEADQPFQRVGRRYVAAAKSAHERTLARRSEVLSNAQLTTSSMATRNMGRGFTTRSHAARAHSLACDANANVAGLDPEALTNVFNGWLSEMDRWQEVVRALRGATLAGGLVSPYDDDICPA